jgi:AraC family transcriptional regulator
VGVNVAIETLWYLESHLNEDLSLDTVADAVGISRFHLSRAFALVTGHSVSEYVRARRLSEAAKALAGGAPDILELAVAWGYGSHEAFTRAFRQRFGRTPEQVRAQCHTQTLELMEPMRMNTPNQHPLAKPRVVRHDALLVFGITAAYNAGEDQGTAGIPAQWERFRPFLGNVSGQVGKDAYGICYNTDSAGHFDYISGVEVSEFPAQPAEFARLRVPPLTYAVFRHEGHISSIQASWGAIWQHALRDAGLQAADGPAIERYGAEFDGDSGEGGVELWVPIRA